jgi:fused signal recognition particle receptor
LDARNFENERKRNWWPLFGRKSERGRSFVGWRDDLRFRPSVPAQLPLPAPPVEAVAFEAPRPAPAPIPRIAEPPPPIVEKAREELPPPPKLFLPPAPALEPTPEPAVPPPVVARAPEPEILPPPAAQEPAKRESLFARLKRGLTRSAESLAGGITQIFTTRKIDADSLQDLEDLLISSDLGIAAAGRLTETLRSARVESGDDIKELLAQEVERVLKPSQIPLAIDAAHKPHVVLVVGVNGTGKTTTIGKLAHKLKAEGKSVMIAAGDTFRAAAVEQLKIWGERTGSSVISRETGSDAAGLAFDALEKAKADNIDVLLIDTAGRLQNKAALMSELEKIARVIKKLDPGAPHSVVQVLDATTGQNAISQVEAFYKTAGVTGLVMTKLDGTARGGILVPLTEKFHLPIYAIGVGEAVEDLQPFDAALFAKALAGLDEAA